MNLEMFYRTAWERHRIYVLKELGAPKPWTQSVTFQNSYFCNVFRDFDKTSQFILEVMRRHENDPELWKGVFLMRFLSNLETLRRLDALDCLVHNHQLAHTKMREWIANGDKIFPSAFIVNSKTPGGWTDKTTYIFRLIKEAHNVIPNIDAWLSDPSLTLQIAYETLLPLPGVGPFMAYQYVVDFHYVDRYLKNAPDARTWTVLGIGAQRGINRLVHGTSKKTALPNQLELSEKIYRKWQKEIALNKEAEIRKTWLKIKDLEIASEDQVADLYDRFDYLEMCDVEHWACEYDKYMRGGSGKRGYRGA